jgi:hypothetical protein
MKLQALSMKFQRFVVGHFSSFKCVKFQLPSVATTCMSRKHHGFWNLFICEVWITSNGGVALRVEGVRKENIASNLWLLLFKTKDPPTTSCFLKWGLSHSLGYGVYLHFFKWRIWIFFMIVVLKILLFGDVSYFHCGHTMSLLANFVISYKPSQLHGMQNPWRSLEILFQPHQNFKSPIPWNLKP